MSDHFTPRAYPKFSGRIRGVNGINTHGEGNTDLMLDKLSGHFHVEDVYLRKANPFTARWYAKRDAKDVARGHSDGDAYIAHSFGAHRLVVAMRDHGVVPSHVFFFRPATASTHAFNRPGIYCWYGQEDFWVRVGAIMLFHPFGRAGSNGFDDPMVHNHKSTGPHNADFTEHLDERCEAIKRILGGSLL